MEASEFLKRLPKRFLNTSKIMLKSTWSKTEVVMHVTYDEEQVSGE
jgi:hypothetical protein